MRGSPDALLRLRLRRLLGSRARTRNPLLQTLRLIAHYRWKAVLFGGLPRDLMVYGPGARIRDVDIVVAGATVADIATVFRD